MNKYRNILLLLCLVFISLSIQAQPDFSNVVIINDIHCYGDLNKPNLFYYPPGELSVVTNREGMPDFNFLQMRYTGNIAYGDQGQSRFSSIVRFRIKMDRMSQTQLSEIKKKIWGVNKKGELRPLPIIDMKSNLVFTSIEEQTDTIFSGDCTITSENNDGNSKKGSYWKEREFSLRLDNLSTQALWKALEKGNTLMSLSYSFYSKGTAENENEIQTTGDTTFTKTIEDLLTELNDSIAPNKRCIKSNAFALTIDTEKWPDLLKKIDINEQIPPGYAALEIRCYDFNNELRPDLYSKSVEVKAEGVGRGDVTVVAKFNKNNPDVYVQYIRFPYAVKLDKLPQYRVKSISDDAPPAISNWTAMDTWTQLIDITSSEDEIPELDEQY